MLECLLAMRLDVYLVKNKIVESREKAKHIIKDGKVCLNGKIVAKASKKVSEKDKIDVTEDFKYVGRGGYKLEKAMNQLRVNFEGKTIVDIGCSTGGFTDYALRNGAKKVYAIDIGDPLHDFLRANRRIKYIPNTDVLKLGDLPEKVDLCLIDVTFSRIEEVLFHIFNWLGEGGEVVALIKPPFQVGDKARKINDSKKCWEIAENVARWATQNSYIVKELVESQIRGKNSKQLEFFLYLKRI